MKYLYDILLKLIKDAYIKYVYIENAAIYYHSDVFTSVLFMQLPVDPHFCA